MNNQSTKLLPPHDASPSHRMYDTTHTQGANRFEKQYVESGFRAPKNTHPDFSAADLSPKPFLPNLPFTVSSLI